MTNMNHETQAVQNYTAEGIIRESMAEGLIKYELLIDTKIEGHPDEPGLELFEVQSGIFKETSTIFVAIPSGLPEWKEKIAAQLTQNVSRGELHLKKDVLQLLERQEPLTADEKTIRSYLESIDGKLHTLSLILEPKDGAEKMAGLSLAQTPSPETVQQFIYMGCWDIHRNQFLMGKAQQEYLKLMAEEIAVNHVADTLGYEAARYVPNEEMEQILFSVRNIDWDNVPGTLETAVELTVDNSPYMDAILERVGAEPGRCR